MSHGTLTLSGTLFQETFICTCVGCPSPDNTSRRGSLNSHAELFPVHSPLLKESCLVFCPPLTYMLKFSGFAGLISCQQRSTTKLSSKLISAYVSFEVPQIIYVVIPNAAPLSELMPRLVTLRQTCFQEFPESAVCVQEFTGSRNSASHRTYHTSLCSSSTLEPRHPSLKVISVNAEKICYR